MDTKHNADEVNDRVPGISAISGIKTEPSGDDTDKCDVDSKEPIKMSELESPTTSGNVEQVFIKKEDDPDAGGTASISIKSEPPGDEWDKYIAEDKSIVEMETENYKLDMEMSCKVKPELLIKKEWDNDPAAVYEVSARRIKQDSDELEAGPAGGVKQEADMEDDEDYQLTEDCDIKSESDASMDAASDVPSNSMEKSIISRKHQVIYETVGSKSFTCYICNYTALSKHLLIDHMTVHDNEKCVPGCTKRDLCNASASVSSKTDKLWTCGQCDATYKGRRGLDEHVARKHPEFVTSITSKLHECRKCTFKTTVKSCFNEHSLNHPEFGSDFSISNCIHCNATFKEKRLLDDHVVKKHPEFITTVDRKIYECPKCFYRTTLNKNFKRHMCAHPDIVSGIKLRTCVHCNATFKTKKSLDYHVVGKHPEFVKSVTSKLYECTKCTFKTTVKGYFDRHLLKHPEVASDFKYSICIHCNATFVGKLSLDNHVLRRHPEFVASVTSKQHKCTKCTFKTLKKILLDNHVVSKHPEFVTSITSKLHECTKCTFKTVLKSEFNRHLLKHPEVASDFKHSVCIHCSAAFKEKRTLDDHVVRKHPEFITTVARKIYECPKCCYRTTVNQKFKRHMFAHP